MFTRLVDFEKKNDKPERVGKNILKSFINSTDCFNQDSIYVHGNVQTFLICLRRTFEIG